MEKKLKDCLTDLLNKIVIFYKFIKNYCPIKNLNINYDL